MPADTTLRPPTFSELRVIQLVGAGMTNRQIAGALCIGEDTVKRHLARLFKAWQVGTRIELVGLAIREGWLACPMCGPGSATAAVVSAAANALRTHAMGLDMLASQITYGGDNHG